MIQFSSVTQDFFVGDSVSISWCWSTAWLFISLRCFLTSVKSFLQSSSFKPVAWLRTWCWNWNKWTVQRRSVTRAGVIPEVKTITNSSGRGTNLSSSWLKEPIGSSVWLWLPISSVTSAPRVSIFIWWLLPTLMMDFNPSSLSTSFCLLPERWVSIGCCHICIYPVASCVGPWPLRWPQDGVCCRWITATCSLPFWSVSIKETWLLVLWTCTPSNRPICSACWLFTSVMSLFYCSRRSSCRLCNQVLKPDDCIITAEMNPNDIFNHQDVSSKFFMLCICLVWGASTRWRKVCTRSSGVDSCHGWDCSRPCRQSKTTVEARGYNNRRDSYLSGAITSWIQVRWRSEPGPAALLTSGDQLASTELFYCVEGQGGREGGGASSPASSWRCSDKSRSWSSVWLVKWTIDKAHRVKWQLEICSTQLSGKK